MRSLCKPGTIGTDGTLDTFAATLEDVNGASLPLHGIMIHFIDLAQRTTGASALVSGCVLCLADSEVGDEMQHQPCTLTQLAETGASLLRSGHARGAFHKLSASPVV